MRIVIIILKGTEHACESSNECDFYVILIIPILYNLKEGNLANSAEKLV